MRTPRQSFRWLLAGTALSLGAVTASAHIGYNGRDFGTVVPNAAPVTLTNQTVSGNHGWADGTDYDFGDSHKVRAYRFTLAAPAYVTLTFSASTNGDTQNGGLKPAFSIYKGLAHLPPISTAPGGSADHDGSAISQAYLASLGQGTKEGVFRALNDWRVGGENQTGPEFNFDAADGLSTFVFKGYAADGDATLFGPATGIVGDGNADGTVTKSLYLPAGDYSVFVGGASYAAQFPTPDATVYGVTGTVSATAFSYVAADPAEGGIGYQHQVTLGTGDSGSFSSHVGAWSWEDSSLFGPGEPPVGWTHTSNWVALKIQKDTVLTVRMLRDATVPWPSTEEPDRKADISSMYPSLTLYRGWDNDGDDFHSYNNRGNVAWAEDLQYVDHVDNSTQESITRSWILPAGEYTIALGSNAPATNLARQGFRMEFETHPQGKTDPAPGGIGYTYTVVAGAGETNTFSSHVGAWSWEDNALFSPGQPPVGWTHTSNWLALKLTEDVYFSLTVERDANVPWPSQENPDRKADTSSMFPSFTLWRGWDNDGEDLHTYNNRGNVLWAEDIRYVDHVDNSTADKVTRVWRLPAGEYTVAIGSNAPANNTLRQGYKATCTTTSAAKVITGDAAAGGIGYAHVITVGRGDSGTISNHVGAWSWEDNSLFNAANGEPPVGWTHTSRWVALQVTDNVTLNVTMGQDANVPWPAANQPDRKADTASMFPSFTLYRGWDNDGGDSHMYSNRGNVSWAEDISYLDHYANSAQPTITRSYTLAPGYYTFALGSNAPANNTNRQGFSFSWTTGVPVAQSPIITQQPRGLEVIEGKAALFIAKASGPGVGYQWFRNGVAVPNATQATLQLEAASAAQAGNYTVEARNAAGWATSQAAALSVVSMPEIAPFDIPDLAIGQSVEVVLSSSGSPVAFAVKGLPKGLKFDAKTSTISGRPQAVSAEVIVEVTAKNKAGISEKATDTFAVSALADGISGSFTGALGRAAGINDFLGGNAKFQVSSLGALTGTVTLGAKSHKLTALLDTSLDVPTASLSLPRPGQAALTLNLQINGGAKTLYGTLTDGTTTLPFVARQPLAPAGAYAGDYTSALLPSAQDGTDATLPQGTSVAAFSVAANGTAKGVLLLADNSRVTFSGPLEQFGYLTVYSVLYKGAGSVSGIFAIEAPVTVGEISSTTGNLAASEISWFKSEVTKDRTYGAGFGPLDLQVVGRKYTAPANDGLPLNATPGAGNASLSFAHAGVSDPETRLNLTSVELTAKTTKIAGANPGKVKLTVTAGAPGKFSAGTSASFKGSFELTDNDTTVTPAKPVKRTSAFQGMIVDDGEGLKGYGFFLLPQMPTASPPTTIKTAPILSGSVLLETRTIQAD